ncbi:MAG: DegT/DnrJ/EryC1/StrS family aminotransferase [Dinghuibacter sp.]|nr:DegT/DnrJ/EryC1/StrS family aminotransferase [Dinghuibacter sp.]
MHPIQMVDTKRQYQKIKQEIDQAVSETIESSIYIGGKNVTGFAENLAQYLGVKHVIPCANGTDALQVAFMALDLQPGDEVITPSFTYIATVEAAALLKIKPVFVEVDPQTFCINPASLEAAITPKTKAIVPVHLYGQSADMEPIMAIARKHNLYVVEDNAQAIGSEYTFSDGTVKKTASIGDIGCISFYPSKNLGAFGDGGAITTNSDELAAKLKMIAVHGQSKQYYHDVVGCNSRLDSIQAAILNVKLKYLDGYNAARIALADTYDKAFAGNAKIRTPFRAANNKHVFHQYTIILDVEGNAAEKRNALKDHLQQQGIPSMIYYPVPSHKQKMFEAYGGSAYELPVTDWLNDRVISLPMHTEMDADQAEYITHHVLNFVNNL